jgi:hypothetical protein
MGTDERAFGSWHLRGGRYEEHGLPVEVLSEFARYERLVVDVAKAIYMRRNAHRQRAPRQFSQFSLRLAAVREGSVIPVLEVPRELHAPIFAGGEFGVFNEARLLIQEALRSVASEGNIPASFPPNALREFSRFGRSLQKGEYFSFDEDTPHAATYSWEIRRSIQELARLEHFEVETTVPCQVTGLNADEGTFRVRLARNGRTIAGRFSSDDTVSDLRQYLDVSTLAPTVAISAVAIQSIGEEIIEIRDVLNVEPLLPAEWSERLLELSKLQSGWMEGSGEPVSKRVLRQTESLLLELLDLGVSRPYIYPTESGGVQLEWTGGAGEVAAEITKNEGFEIYAFSEMVAEDLDRSFASHEIDEAAQFLLEGIRRYAA